jgi:hopanoid biosynthesis associated RND transporter like protein HpnN
MKTILGALVETSRRHAVAVVVAAFILACAGGLYVARGIAIDSDTGKLVDPNLPWLRASADISMQFPQNQHLILVVVDGSTADSAADAAGEMARRLRARPDLFSYVRQPDANPYFRRYGLLFLPTKEVQDFSDHLIAAQPFLGTLAADPSVRGVLNAIDLLAQGGLRGEADAAAIDPALRVVGQAAEAARDGRRDPLAWQSLLSGRKTGPGDLRHFILAQARLNYGQVEAGAAAIAAIRAEARAAGFGPGSGVTVRITGPVALNNDQLAVLSDSATVTGILCVGLLLFWLAVGLRSLRTMIAILLTLGLGLIGCAVFAVAAIGPFSPVSIAFAPLFIGIAIDFGIQFSVRYTAERIQAEAPAAFARTAVGVGPPLLVAAVATAAGFLAFAPTAYLGVRDLGLIAGVGMILALLLNLTLLPALLQLLRPRAQPHAAGFAAGVRLDSYLGTRKRTVLTVALCLAALAAIAIPGLRLDFNPLDLQNQKAESVRTLFDMMADPNSSPYTIEYLLPRTEAVAAAAKLSTLPEVSRVLTAASFVPADQAPKLEILADTTALLGPTLNPAVVQPPPTAAEAVAALRRCAGDMTLLGANGDAAAAALGRALGQVAQEGDKGIELLAYNLGGGIAHRLDDLREVLKAAPMTQETLPADFLQDWVAPDGRWHVQVFPTGDTRDNRVLRHFAQVVRQVVPQAVGSAVEVDEWTRLAPRAFATAGSLAVVAISLLLLAVLRSLREVLLVLVPLAVAGVLTLGAASVLGFSINFANIITLPMMLGIGVAFDIYFVMRWRAGEPGLLGSPTARGVVFSALTTGTAFGSLALSRSPGMAEMGKFLSLALFFILLCTLFVLPALLAERPAGGRKGT